MSKNHPDFKVPNQILTIDTRKTLEKSFYLQGRNTGNQGNFTQIDIIICGIMTFLEPQTLSIEFEVAADTMTQILNLAETFFYLENPACPDQAVNI